MSTEPERPREGGQRAPMGRLAAVLLGLVAAVGATYVVPALHPLRPWSSGSDYVPFWNVVGREWLGQGKELDAEAARLAQQRSATEAPVVAARKAPPPPPVAKAAVFPPHAPATKAPRPERGIEPEGALDSYFRKLTLVDLGVPRVLARAGHWGDSVLGMDGITSGIRRRLQARFGDGGHGFHLMDRYNPSYQQQGIEFEPGGGWGRCLIVDECDKRDRQYGYGGLLVRSLEGGAGTWATAKKGFGSTASRFELWFARQPGGGKLEVIVDRKNKVMVDASGPALEDAWHEVRVPPGSHRFSVRAIGGRVRTYGIVMENDGPGVVWDGMALIGGSTRGLRTQNPEHIASQIRHRDPDLLVFMFGGNDMQRNYVDLKHSMQPYHDEFRDVLGLFRAGKPGVSCLVMSLTDHGRRTADDRVVSRDFAKVLARAQGEIARANGCGFFDTYEATGGEGTAGRWYRASPRLIAPDLGHPNGLGHELIAGLLVNALLHAYEGYRTRMEGEPLPELGGAPASSVHGPGGAGDAAH